MVGGELFFYAVSWISNYFPLSLLSTAAAAAATNNMRLCPSDVLERGFSALNAYGPDFKPKWCQARIDDFKKFYGSTPIVLTDIWHDMMTTDICLKLTNLYKFLMAHHFLWAYPKNSKLLASTFKHIGERDARGEELWRWVNDSTVESEENCVGQKP